MRLPLKAALPLVALAVLGLLALGQGTARAVTTWVVDDDGVQCPSAAFDTIQEAVDAAIGGDIIQVCAGTYTETVTVNKQLTINGAQAGLDARTRTGAAESIVNDPNGAFNVTFNGVIIDGFTIEGATDTVLGYGVVFSGSFSGYRFQNNIVQDNIAGVYLNSQGTSQTLVRHNLFKDNNEAGAASGNGIYADQGPKNVLVEENSFSGHTSSAMVFDSFVGPNSQITIKNNETSGDATLMAIFNSTNSSITGNTVTGGGGSAIFVGNGVSGLTIEKNIIGAGTSNGVRVNDFGVGPVSNLTVTNNAITGRNRGVSVATGALATELEVHNNSITGSIADAVLNDDTDSPVDASANWWGSNDPATVAPEMAGAGAVDFNPLLDSGTDTATGTPGFQPNLATDTVHTLGTEITSSRIQDGVTYVNASGTVNVNAGVYGDGPANIAKTVTILGPQAGVDARTRSVAESAESVITGGMTVAENNVVIDGLMFKDVPYVPTLGGASVYLVPSKSGYTVRNNIFRGGVFGLYLNSLGTTQSVVRHNFFDDNNGAGPASGNGIYADQGSRKVLVEENKFEDHTNAAMVFDTFLGPNSQLTIKNNSSVNDATLLAVFSSTDVDVVNNTFDGPSNPDDRGSGILVGGSDTDVLIDGNSVTKARRAVRVGNFTGSANSNVTVTDNSLTSSECGIHVANGAMSGHLEAHFNRITDNTILTPPPDGPFCLFPATQNDDTDLSETVDAEKNWWGDPFGPSGEGPGSGDPVSLNVDFDPWCFNATCTKFGVGGGDSGDNTITGTSGDDVIFGGPGDDTIFGLGGNDELHGEDGDDRLEGGSGSDQLDGGEGDDLILGGSGNDTGTGGNGADEMRGGSGNDEFRGGPGRDEIFGGSGNDRLFGEGGADLVDGGDGKDFISGGSGNDRLQARDGQTDTVRGGTGTDTADVDGRDNVSGVERRV
jgi:hypothetical protein